jgi:hypothetical protein
MAIIIQENGGNRRMIPLTIGLAVLAVVAFLMYQFFFAPTPEADIVESEGYNSATVFSQATLSVEEVINSPVWTSISARSNVPPLITGIDSPKENIFKSFLKK